MSKLRIQRRVLQVVLMPGKPAQCRLIARCYIISLELSQQSLNGMILYLVMDKKWYPMVNLKGIYTADC